MRKRLAKIARSITGLSCPIFGISWQPPEAEIETAIAVINYLEDRRVLYNEHELEIPEHCVRSIIEIRHELTNYIGELEAGSELAANLKAMRAAARKCLDLLEPDPIIILHARSAGHYASWRFMDAIGQMRGVFGVHIAAIMLKYGLEVEEDLAKILPSDEVELE